MKKIFCTLASLCLVLIIVGCSWESPQTISVKTDAEYNFSLGTFEKDFSEYLNLSTMMGEAFETSESDNNPNGIKLLDYWPDRPNSNVQHFLLQIKVFEQDFSKDENGNVYPFVETAIASTPDGDPVQLNGIGTYFTTESQVVGLEFNPSTILSGMTSQFGEGLGNKIKLESLNTYLYCSVPGKNIVIPAEIYMFYGSKTKEAKTEKKDLLKESESKSLKNSPLIDYSYEKGAVINNLQNEKYLASVNISDLLNVEDNFKISGKEVTDEDQLCIEYKIKGIEGSLSKEALLDDGLTIALYAVVDIPLSFEVTDNIELDLSKMTGSDSSESSSENAKNNNSEASENEFSKYLNVIEALTVKYVAYKLPFVASSGNMQLGIGFTDSSDDIQWARLNIINESTNITEDDKSKISITPSIIEKIQTSGNFVPNFTIKMDNGTVFSLPREKAIKMNLELALKANGDEPVQVK